MNSLFHSNILAQEEDLSTPWREIICPNFVEDGFEGGDFWQYCQELKFLIFLVSCAKEYKADPLDFMARLIQEKYQKSDAEELDQLSLFQRYNLKKELFYDRIVLHAVNLTASNAHHFLISKIQKQKKSLTKQGQLIVLTNQKLFIPSQGHKIVQLLQDFNVELHMNLENLKGKGNIPNYMYILSNKMEEQQLPLESENTSIPTFRWSGTLSSFEEFNLYIEEMNNFFQDKNSVSTPIYQKDLTGNHCFEFHKDAILDGGILLSSTSKNNNSSITHPSFFKGLTRSCSPLEQFFLIKQLGTPSPGLLGVSLKEEDSFPLILIVNCLKNSQISLEIIPSDSYKAKQKEYGIGPYHYFGLVPKNPGLNINLFRELFATDLGHQIIQLSLQGGNGKLKTKLKSILIPNFLAYATPAPPSLQGKSTILHHSLEEIKRIHPQEIMVQWKEIFTVLDNDHDEAPWYKMGILSNFKFQLESILKKSSGDNKNIDFNSAMIKNALTKLKVYPVYPNHEDIYLEFFSRASDDSLALPLEELSFQVESGHHALNLISGEGETIVRLHSEDILLEFVAHLFRPHCGYPISSLIKNLGLPRLVEFKKALQNCAAMDQCLSKIYGDIKILIDNILMASITGR